VNTKKDVQIEDLRLTKSVNDTTVSVRVQRSGVAGILVVRTDKKEGAKPVKTYTSVKTGLKDAVKVYNRIVSAL
jgi:hypothetical protein